MDERTGIEIFDLRDLNKAGFGQVGVYINVGYPPYPEKFNPLPISEFESYQPDEGFAKNTGLRTALFTGGFISSPLLEDGEYSYIDDSRGYTWLYNTFNTMAVTPFRRELYPTGVTQYSAALYGPPPEGSIQVIVNDKNQPQTFASRDATGSSIDYCFATDSHGNSFILGAVDTAYAGDVVAAFEQAVLPDGWAKSVRSLDGDFTIYPGYGDGNRRVFNQFRDNLTNNYFQITWSQDGQGIVRGIPGLPLSGGNGDDRILGSNLNEKIYGARGNDVLTGVGGRDQIWGDEGDDIIQPGSGASKLWGGAGADAFTIKSGRSTIMDFSKEEGDVINLNLTSSAPSQRQRRALRKSLQLQQIGNDVKISNLHADILVHNATMADLMMGQTLLL